MLHTQQNTEIFRSNLDHRQLPDLQNSLNIVKNFENEPVFIEQLTKHGIDPHDRTSVDYANALSYYAQDYCNTRADMLEPKQSQEISLIASTPRMLHVSQEIAQYEGMRKTRRLDDSEWSYLTQTLKPYSVEYNQNLSDYIFKYSDTNFKSLNETLADGAYDSFPHRESAVEQQIKIISRGARTEAVGRHLLEDTPIEYTPGTPEDDLRGGDIIIIYKGKRIKVDFKSSLDSIAKLRGGYDEITEKKLTYALVHNKRDQYGSIVLFPGFTDNDLGDNCRLPKKMAEERSFSIMIQLQRACHELGL